MNFEIIGKSLHNFKGRTRNMIDVQCTICKQKGVMYPHVVKTAKKFNHNCGSSGYNKWLSMRWV